MIGIKKNITLFILLFSGIVYSQENNDESNNTFKRRVLESAEVDFLMSYYEQDGDHAAVTGGIGTEELTDITPTIIVSLPLNDDDVLTVEAGISAYTSASSSNLDPFDNVTRVSTTTSTVVTGASSNSINSNTSYVNVITPTPWLESTGASAKDTWVSGVVSYAHSSDDRNTVWGANASFATEYDYSSIGFGGSITKLLNQKNTEIGISGQVYLDTWNPHYPTELDSYLEAGRDLNNGFFGPVDIFNQAGNPINKDGVLVWDPDFELISDESRNSYALSLSFSQILSSRAQFSIFADVVQQSGYLANPMQRVYFSDKLNYYIGNPDYIPVYDTPENIGIFQLADDIEQLPDTRFKTPIGIRFNYYLNEIVSLRTYYRYYSDDWGVSGHTASIELPIKLGSKFTLYPNYRYYNQTAADYFAPYEEHLSTSEYYTSDYDLSAFNSNQYGAGIKYTDLLAEGNIFGFGLKSIDLRYSTYDRSDGLTAGIISFGIKFVQ